MPKNLSEFITMMDERLWFRMVVCFLPPLIIVKLASYSDNVSLLNKTSTGVLVLGVALYVFWGRLRSWTAGEENDAGQDGGVSEYAGVVDVTEEQPGGIQLAMLAELRGLCQEPERESEKLIAIELAVNAKISYAEATRRAIARKSILAK
jgi:hypothetical protein